MIGPRRCRPKAAGQSTDPRRLFLSSLPTLVRGIVAAKVQRSGIHRVLVVIEMLVEQWHAFEQRIS